MPRQPAPHVHRLAETPRYPAAEGRDEYGRGHGAQQGVRDVLEQEDAHDLAGGEADRLQDRDVPEVAADAGDDRAVRGEPRGQQRAQPEQSQYLAQQPVVALCAVPGLLPGGHLGDRVGAQAGHGALDDVGGVLRVGQAQSDDPAVGCAQGGGRQPDQPRLLSGAVLRLGAVGDAHDGQGAVRTRQAHGVTGLGQQGAGQTALQDDAVGVGRAQPVAGGEQRASDGRLPGGGAAQLHRGAGAVQGERGGTCGVGARDGLHPVQAGQCARLGGGVGVEPHVCSAGLGERALPGVGGVDEERHGQQQGGDDPHGGEHDEQGFAAMSAQVGVGPARHGSHRAQPFRGWVRGPVPGNWSCTVAQSLSSSTPDMPVRRTCGAPLVSSASSAIRPSKKLMTRSPALASRASWVTSTMV